MTEKKQRQGMPESQSKTPGQLLIEARQRAFLTEKDVAERLRLSTITIRSIEADRYAEIAAPVYVRGYLSSYARLLGLSTEVLLAAFESCDVANLCRAGSSERATATYEGSPVYKQPHRSDFKVKRSWLLLGFGASCVMLVALWWHGQGSHLAVVSAHEGMMENIPLTAVVAQKAVQPIVQQHASLTKANPEVKFKKPAIQEKLASPQVTYQLVPID